LNKKYFSKASLTEYWEYLSRRDSGEPLSVQERIRFVKKNNTRNV
jgi:hypothetical protein